MLAFYRISIPNYRAYREIVDRRLENASGAGDRHPAGVVSMRK